VEEYQVSETKSEEERRVLRKSYIGFRFLTSYTINVILRDRETTELAIVLSQTTLQQEVKVVKYEIG